jgi:hypothetical protein
MHIEALYAIKLQSKETKNRHFYFFKIDFPKLNFKLQCLKNEMFFFTEYKNVEFSLRNYFNNQLNYVDWIVKLGHALGINKENL